MIIRKPTKERAEVTGKALEYSMRTIGDESGKYERVRYGMAMTFEPEPGETLDDAQRAARDWITGRT